MENGTSPVPNGQAIQPAAAAAPHRGLCVVLVDAGYLYAQLAETLTGSNKPRHEMEVDERALVALLSAKAAQAFPGCDLLRVHWYDAPPSREQMLSASQERLGMCGQVKLRMGTLNGNGQQKGVDSLICSDISSLRAGGVRSFLLVSGDEDLRLAVEQAQMSGCWVKLAPVGHGMACVGKQLWMESDGVCRMERREFEALAHWRQAPAQKGAAPAAQGPLAGASRSNPKAGRSGPKGPPPSKRSNAAAGDPKPQKPQGHGQEAPKQHLGLPAEAFAKAAASKPARKGSPRKVSAANPSRQKASKEARSLASSPESASAVDSKP